MASQGDAGPNDDSPKQEFAGPETRRQNERLIGAFLLAHNEVDFALTNVLLVISHRIRNDGSLDNLCCTGSFDQRLKYLEIMQVCEVLNIDADFSELRKINRIRNIICHGHYDEDPFSGDYSFIQQSHAVNKRQTNLSIDCVSQATERLQAIASTMRMYAECQHYVWPNGISLQEIRRSKGNAGAIDTSEF
jgi:hypothetical protein